MKNTKEKTLFGETGCVMHYDTLIILAEAKDNLPVAIYHSYAFIHI